MGGRQIENFPPELLISSDPVHKTFSSDSKKVSLFLFPRLLHGRRLMDIHEISALTMKILCRAFSDFSASTFQWDGSGVTARVDDFLGGCLKVMGLENFWLLG